MQDTGNSLYQSDLDSCVPDPRSCLCPKGHPFLYTPDFQTSYSAPESFPQSSSVRRRTQSKESGNVWALTSRNRGAGYPEPQSSVTGSQSPSQGSWGFSEGLQWNHPSIHPTFLSIPALHVYRCGCVHSTDRTMCRLTGPRMRETR